jgi:hypothetical protein
MAAYITDDIGYIPVMTSNSSPSPFAASCINAQIGDAYNVFDSNDQTYWHSSWPITVNDSNPVWVQIKLDKPIQISKYSMFPRCDCADYPISWHLDGSNDGITWTVVDSQSNKDVWTTTQTFIISDIQAAFQFYRINITDFGRNGGSNQSFANLGSLQLFRCVSGYNNFYLIDDGVNGIKHWDTSSDKFVKVADPPITEAVFKSYGDTTLYSSRAGIVSNNPGLLFWTDDPGSPETYTAVTTAAPKPMLVLQNTDYNITTAIKSAVTTVNLSGSGVIKLVCSVDGGVTWKTWTGSAWATIDISNLSNVDTSALTPTVLNSLTQSQWQLLTGSSQLIRLGWYLKQSVSKDVCNVDSIRINYV